MAWQKLGTVPSKRVSTEQLVREEITDEKTRALLIELTNHLDNLNSTELEELHDFLWLHLIDLVRDERSERAQDTENQNT